MFGKKQETPTTRLRELSKSDFTIAKGEPDIRGWDVRDAQRIKFGTVQELIFDIRAGKVRYLVLQILDTAELDLEKRVVMVPIGLAELDPSDNDVLLPTVNPFQLRALPRYDRAKLGAKAERDVATVFGHQAGNNNVEDVDEQFYNHDHFNQGNLYRQRNNLPGSTTNHNGGIPNRPLHRTETTERHTVPVHNNRPLSGEQTDAESDEAYFRRTGRRRHEG